jgi:hypothetical protein
LLIECLLEFRVLLDFVLNVGFHNNHFFNDSWSWGSNGSGLLGFGFRGNKLECGTGNFGNETFL